jgi:DNA-binding IclR family transcriptional regulator
MENVLNRVVTAAIEGKPGVTAKRGAVGSVAAILRLLAVADEPMGVNSIARAVSMAPSSCFKIMKALVAQDFVSIDEYNKRYSLGSGAIAVAQRALDPAQAYATVRSRLEGSAQTQSIAIGLWRIIPKSRMVLIGFAEGDSQMRIHMAIGQRLPMYVGAVGRAIAARMSPSSQDLKESFDKLRWQKPLSFREYVAQVEQAKRLGYGLDAGYFAPGVSTVAVAIVDTFGEVRYGLSGIMFSGQYDYKMTDKIGRQMIELSKWAAGRLISQPVDLKRA